MDLSNFQLTDTMSEMDILREFPNTYQRQQQQQQDYSFSQDMDLLFSNSSPQVGSSSFLGYQKNPSPDYRTTSQPECYSQEVFQLPMTPSFDYPIQSHTNKNMNFSSELNFSPLSSPAMPPQTDRSQKTHLITASQIREQYDQLEQAKRLINEQLSEMQQRQQQPPLNRPQLQPPPSKPPQLQPLSRSCSPIKKTTKTPAPKRMKPATPASLMSLSRSKGSQKSKPIKKKRDNLIDTPRALKPLLISPTLRPGPNKDEEEAERILATRSNYQNLMEGKGPALGIAFHSQIKSGLEVRRTAHKAAEQKRRDSLKEWFDKLRCEVEEGYVKRQKSLMSQVIQAQELEGSESLDTMKPLSKVLLLQYAYEYIDDLKAKLSEKDAIIQRLSDS
ncbi:hypothetical protein G6F56_005566 [Rhizopus delemar]|nr:hypothetical protein G6F56_005566 [Rhizopus delemar]